MMQFDQPVSEDHLLVRLMGHGLCLTPLSLFDASQVGDDSGSVDITLHSGAFARVLPAEGGYQSKIDPATTKTLRDVVHIDMAEGVLKAGWKIQTSRFSCVWPPALKLRSNRYPSEPSPFDLFTDYGLLIYVQSPRVFPSLAAMAAPGQDTRRLVPDSPHPFVELTYQHQSVAWVQRHAVINLGASKIILSAQFPASHEKTDLMLVLDVEDSIQATAY